MADRRPLKKLTPFTRAEFENRAERARALMHEQSLDALLLSSESNFKYLTGFTTQNAWNIPARPWFFVLPLEGEPIAVIPEGGREGYETSSWTTNMRTWMSPQPEDEGVTLLAETLSNLPRRFGRIGAELGRESRMWMPVGDFLRLREQVLSREFVDGQAVMREVRYHKSPAEIDRIRTMCQITCDGFDALPGFIEPGDTERDVYRKLQAEMLLGGATKVIFMACVSGPGGYENIIGEPSDRVLGAGDVMIIDTGGVYGDYFCDFDRNFSWGPPTDEIMRIHEVLHQATDAAIAAARPGAKASDIWRAQAGVIDEAGCQVSTVGRMGHGLGMNLTEPPSIKEDDHTPLHEGMVITIEPSTKYGPNFMLVHEEDVAITADGCDLLTRRAPREMPVIPV